MAKKNVKVFFCNECGYESSKWLGQCPGCKSWNTFVEEIIDKKTAKASKDLSDLQSKSINDIDIVTEDRFTTGFKEFDRVLGGGVVDASLVLVGGDPGIGKSTLLLQMCKGLSDDKREVLYVSGEESLAQIRIRADRIGSFKDNMMLLCETNLERVAAYVDKSKPDVMIVDSIQTMYIEDVSSAPGSVSQVREATSLLMRLAKDKGISIFVVGHVTKEGAIAGPRVLEHMVDTVLYLEGDRYASYRILRAVKNRFGSTNEIGVFEMRNTGLIEVSNPSEYMLEGKENGATGSIVSASMEGSRPLLVEVQALCTQTAFGMPRRTAAGFDYNRLNLLMAVLEKNANMHLSNQDAYVNIAGGLRIGEPAIDLAIVLAVVSSYRNRAIDSDIVCFGEVGLSGEIRSVNMAAQRVSEAAKLGFTRCVLPKSSLKQVDNSDGIELIGVSNIIEAIGVI